ncbi:DGQHR domain-containing protein, partial [Alistipes putredinis]|uniref:DGQHR domain-containing protein n=1 Tax=Alistipes putredinis TaxID=28117 RepID=UPI003AB39E22
PWGINLIIHKLKKTYRIMGQNGIIIKGFPVQQNGQDFIIWKASIKDILTYTRYTERLIIGFDEDEKPIYNPHIQRKVETSRVNKIADFLINDPEAMFPTNIVLGIPMSMISSQFSHDGIIEISLDEKVTSQIKLAKEGYQDADIFITIIDGQHRIRGIEVAIERLQEEAEKHNNILAHTKLENLLNMELAISYFIDKSLEYQAMIFSTINRTQKRVSQDLVYSLFGLSSEDTPYKTALEVTLALNAHPKSPFYHRIKLYGGDYDKKMSPPLSQATMIKSIVGLISESLRESENDKYKKRKELKRQKSKKFLPFRKFYADNHDSLISDCLFYFFSTIQSKFPQYWIYDGLSKPQNILQSTVGYEALLSLLVEILNQESLLSFDRNTFNSYINKLENIDFGNTTKFPMTTKGKKIAYLIMSLAVFPPSESSDSREIELLKITNEL